MQHELVGRTFTTAELSRLLNVTMMTLSGWRKGSPDRRPLPVQVKPHKNAKRVLFHGDDLHPWLYEYRPDLLTQMVEKLSHDATGKSAGHEPGRAEGNARRALLPAVA